MSVIDKNRKLPVTTLIRALGLGTDEQIRQFFGDSEPKINASLEKDITHSTEEGLLEVYRQAAPRRAPDGGELPQPPELRCSLTRAATTWLGFGPLQDEQQARRWPAALPGYKAAEDVIAPLTGELLVAKGEKINTAKANEIDAAGVTRVVVLVERKGEESIARDRDLQRLRGRAALLQL